MQLLSIHPSNAFKRVGSFSVVRNAAYNRFSRTSCALQESHRSRRPTEMPHVPARRATITTNQSADRHVSLREREENLCGDARKSAREGVRFATKSAFHEGRSMTHGTGRTCLKTEARETERGKGKEREIEEGRGSSQKLSLLIGNVCSSGFINGMVRTMIENRICPIPRDL